MKPLYLLRKHYVATGIFILSLIVLGYTAWKMQTPIPDPITPPVPSNESTSSTPTIEINSPENTDTGQIRIPELPPRSPDATATTGTAASAPLTTPVPTDHGQGTFIINGQNYPVSFVEGSSVYAVMKQLHDSGTLRVDFKNYSGLGYFVDGINGVKSDTFRAKYWIYYINGAKAQIGISQYSLKSGDVITWKYEAGE